MKIFKSLFPMKFQRKENPIQMNPLEIVSLQFTQKFPGFMPGRYGHCPVEILADGKNALVIITEPESTGSTSVTNQFETIATLVFHKFLAEIYRPEQIVFHAHFVRDLRNRDSVAKVNMIWNPKTKSFENPWWNFLSIESLHKIRERKLKAATKPEPQKSESYFIQTLKGGEA